MWKKIGRALRALALRAGFAALLYYGVWLGQPGPGNVLAWVAWVAALAMVVHTMAVAQHKLPGAEELSLPRWFAIAYDGCAVGLLVWCGWFWTSAAWALVACALQAEYDAARKAAEQRAKAAEAAARFTVHQGGAQ